MVETPMAIAKERADQIEDARKASGKVVRWVYATLCRSFPSGERACPCFTNGIHQLRSVSVPQTAS